jgi:hypothetical protein
VTLRLLGVLLLGLALVLPTFSFSQTAHAESSRRGRASAKVKSPSRASARSKAPSRARAQRGATTKKAHVTRHRSGVKRSYVARHSHRTTYRRYGYYRPRTSIYLGPGYYYGGYYRSGYTRSSAPARSEEATTVVTRRDRYPDLGLAFEMGSIGSGVEGAGGVFAAGLQLRFMEDRFGDLQLGLHIGSPAEEAEQEEASEAAFTSISLDKRVFLPLFGRALRPYGLVGVAYQSISAESGVSLNLGLGLEVKLDDAVGFYGGYTYRYLPFGLEHISEWGQTLEIEGFHAATGGVAFYF